MKAFSVALSLLFAVLQLQNAQDFKSVKPEIFNKKPFLHVNDDDNYWIIGNGVLQREIRFLNNQLYTIAFLNNITRASYCKSPLQSDFNDIFKTASIQKSDINNRSEFLLFTDNQAFHSSCQFKDYRKISYGDTLTLEITLTQHHVEVVIYYRVIKSQAYVSKWLKVKNNTGSAVKINEDIVYERILLDADIYPQNRLIYSNFGNTENFGFYKGNSPLVICENSEKKEGFFFATDAIKQNALYQLFDNYSSMNEVIYPVESSNPIEIEQADSFVTPKVHLGVFSNDYVGLSKERVMSTIGSQNNKHHLINGLAPIYKYPQKNMQAKNAKQNIKQIKELGFNGILFSTHKIPKEYYAACKNRNLKIGYELNLFQQIDFQAQPNSIIKPVYGSKLPDFVKLNLKHDTYNTHFIKNIKSNHPSIIIITDFTRKENPISPDFGLLAATDILCVGTVPDFTAYSIGVPSVQKGMINYSLGVPLNKVCYNGLNLHIGNPKVKFITGILGFPVFSGDLTELSGSDKEFYTKMFEWYTQFMTSSIGDFVNYRLKNEPCSENHWHGILKMDDNGNGQLFIFLDDIESENILVKLPVECSDGYEIKSVLDENFSGKIESGNCGKGIKLPIGKNKTVELYEIKKINQP